MIPSFYSINVAKRNENNEGRYEHYCKIKLSEAYEKDAIKKRDELRKMLGEEFKVELTHVVCYGEPIE